MAPIAHLHFPPCPASRTTRSPAERSCATSGAGALTRLDVCDAHPELMRAAQNIGADIDDECPVCGETNLRLVKYVYGDKLKQANGRAISNNAELRKLGASCDEFACYDVEVCLDCRWNHLRRQSLHGRLHAQLSPARSDALASSRSVVDDARTGTASMHEMHHSSGSGTTVSRAGRVPRRRARRRRAGRSTSSSSGIPQFSQTRVGHARIRRAPLARTSRRHRRRCRW